MRFGPRFQVLRELWIGDRNRSPATSTTRSTPCSRCTRCCSMPPCRRVPRSGLWVPVTSFPARPHRTGAGLAATFPLGSAARAPAIGDDAESKCWDVSITDEDGQLAAELNGCWCPRRPRPRRTTQALPHGAARRAPSGAPISGVTPPSPGDLVAGASEELTADLALWQAYAGFEVGVRELQARYVARAIAALLPDAVAFTPGDLLAAGVMPKYARLLDLLLELALTAGCLTIVIQQPVPPATGWSTSDHRGPSSGAWRRTSPRRSMLSPCSAEAAFTWWRSCAVTETRRRCSSPKPNGRSSSNSMSPLSPRFKVGSWLPSSSTSSTPGPRIVLCEFWRSAWAPAR